MIRYNLLCPSAKSNPKPGSLHFAMNKRPKFIILNNITGFSWEKSLNKRFQAEDFFLSQRRAVVIATP